MAYGKLKADTLVYDNSGSDVEVSISSLGAKADLGSPDFTTDITLKSQAPVKFEDDSGGEYVGLKAPTGVTTYTVTLPAAAPSTGQVLKATSATALGWSADTTLSLLDEDNFATDSATAAASQQSIKAYGAATYQALDADTAKTDVAQQWSKPQYAGFTTVTAASTTNFDFSLGNNFYIDMATAAVSTVTLSNASVGQSGTIIVKGHATNGLAGWNAAFKFSAATPPTITADATKYDRIDYIIYSATHIQMVWQGNF